MTEKFTPEEESKMLSRMSEEIDLQKGGAVINEDGRLEVANIQIESVRQEMQEEFKQRILEKRPNALNHPERGEGEMLLMNDYGSEFDKIPFKTKRKGKIALDYKTGDSLPEYLFPVFVGIDDFIENENIFRNYQAEEVGGSHEWLDDLRGMLMYVITGQFMDQNSEIRRDFAPLVESIRFIPKPGQE